MGNAQVISSVDESLYGIIQFEDKKIRLAVNHLREFDDLYIKLYSKSNDSLDLRFISFMHYRKPSEYIQPTLEQLDLFYDELTNMLKENNIEL